MPRCLKFFEGSVDSDIVKEITQDLGHDSTITNIELQSLCKVQRGISITISCISFFIILDNVFDCTEEDDLLKKLTKRTSLFTDVLGK
ncbi:hypothetical protein RRG08_030855 [Elysia crispata]|uniref:Uncharacterized protein n=1 Tax=Elysia crispata TaxID=231223 RepID=A0AAE0XTN4_9GAST|nr:hypothetical protein RRG08_030855 [Elysia crispata]